MATQDIFGTLERTVIALATAERGRGLLPQGRLGRGLAQLFHRLTGEPGVRPLADPRLEALRVCERSFPEQGTATDRTRRHAGRRL